MKNKIFILFSTAIVIILIAFFGFGNRHAPEQAAVSVDPVPTTTTTAKANAASTAASIQMTESVAQAASAISYKKELIALTNQSGQSAYTGSLTTMPADGKVLSISVENKGDSTIYLNIKRNEEEPVTAKPIRKGEQITHTFEQLEADGISGDWSIYAYSKIGAAMNVSVRAGQL
ncbi:hypothetical protein BBD42_17705 [Paenibacillus sp. BIHB 4019]|uniref:Uncharacterized protein n=1 Tax=Paenibacillus sp. BIHB 4019 TaxID=1870819 RepID=A0A1B2DK53_9BACL|nr:hypothetical protein [Paenibacillus sp. BIHB 4019]ANY68107.1 hypothetical protein BBD42_17705 [Paenibacillus sp. BIHB 4019]